MSSADQQLQRLIEFATTVEGAIALVALLALAVASISKPLIAWAFLVATALTASLSQPFSDEGDVVLTLAPGLAQLQAYGRVIAIIGLLGALPFVLSPASTYFRIAGARPFNYALFAFHAIIVLKFIEYRQSAYAVLSAVIYLLIFFVFGISQTRWVPWRYSAIFPIRAIAAATGLFILGVVYQGLVNRPAMLGNSGRLQGLTSNPQHAATLLASGLPALCCLFEIDRQSKLYRFGYFGLMVACVVLVAWTSSRTGALMCTLSLAVLYRRQLHKLAIILIIAIGSIAVASEFVTDFADNAEMLTRTEDTRSAVWSSQWRSFLKFPVGGAPFRGQSRLGLSENSWLGTAQALGIIGLVPLFAATFFAVRLCRDCSRPSADSDPVMQRIGDTVAAGFTAIAAGSVFEAYFLGVLNFQIFAVALYAMAGYAVAESKAETHDLTFNVGGHRYGR